MLPWRVEAHRLHIGDRFSVSFQRTLRIPDDGREYPLPPGLGVFPLLRVIDYAGRVPAQWSKERSVFLPMYQREAMWLGFDAAPWRPNAVKVGIGRINAVSGEQWNDALHGDPQDYLVCPPQLWLDGVNAGDAHIRQFVAVTLGSGLTVEGQLTGVEQFGGLQLRVFEPKPGRFPDRDPGPAPRDPRVMTAHPISEMGFGAGGMMRQRINPDPYGVDTWDQDNAGGVTVYIVNSEQYHDITGQAPPPTPVDARAYTEAGLPWFELYDEAHGDVPASPRFKDLTSLGAPGDAAAPAIDVADEQIRRMGGRDNSDN
jgi:hypothetical protein